MVNDGDFPTKSRKVPEADATGNVFQEEVVGNKTDAAVTSPTTTKSLMAYSKGTLNQLSSIITLIGQVIDVHQNTVGWCDVDRSARFEISLIDKDSGGIPSGNITPGTYSIDRYRNGSISGFADAGGGDVTATTVETHGFSNGDTVEISGTTSYDGQYVISNVTANTFDFTDTWVATETGTFGGWHEIVSATAFSKSTGLVYLDYFFEDTDWATDDNFKITPSGISVTIGGNTYYPAVTTWMGVIQDISTLEGKVDVIDGVVDSNAVEIGINQSEIASCALEQSTVLSQVESSTDLIEIIDPMISFVLSEVASHVLERSTTLSQIESSTDNIGNDSVTQSEIASCCVEHSETLSQIESSTDNIGDDSVTQSEIASCCLEHSETLSQIESSTDNIGNDSVMQSEIASHALQNSTIDSQVASSLAEGDTDLSDLQSSADAGYDIINSEIASCCLAQSTCCADTSEQMSIIRSSLE